MRGKPRELQHALCCVGLIPAHAGKTVSWVLLRLRRWAHPRACGENCDLRVWCGVFAGSSPRMRGKPWNSFLVMPKVGLIPAHAGKTHGKHAILQPSGAHPRACGENQLVRKHHGSNRGSSPRMRGKRRAWPLEDLPTGLIPAHAGKTPRLKQSGLWRLTHPRACGENPAARNARRRSLGSSPRMRGKHRGGARFLLSRRLIPAHAGKTECLYLLRGIPPAHPRACGENLASPGLSFQVPGSSPRMRGKRLRSRVAQGAWGLIPAHAGKTGRTHP